MKTIGRNGKRTYGSNFEGFYEKTIGMEEPWEKLRKSRVIKNL